MKEENDTKNILKKEIKQLTEELARLKGELRDREEALPAHSVRPHQIMAIEELEDEITLCEKKLERLKAARIYAKGSTSDGAGNTG